MKKILIAVALGLFLFTFTASTYAQGIGFKGIGGRLGFVKPEDVDGTIGFGAHANLGDIIENLTLFPSLEYWSKSEDQFGAEASFSQIAINGDVHYYFPSSGNLSFFVGGGLAILLNKGEVEFLGTTIDDNSTDIGLNLLGGVDFPMGDNLVLTGKGKFVLSDGSIFKITAGITYLLGK